MKLTLSQRKPLKITTEAQDKRPDPSQTTVKTVYNSKEEKGDLIIKGTTNTHQTELKQPVERETPLEEKENHFKKTKVLKNDSW